MEGDDRAEDGVGSRSVELGELQVGDDQREAVFVGLAGDGEQAGVQKALEALWTTQFITG